MATAPLLYAVATLAIALVAGLAPIFSKAGDSPERLRMITTIASGILLASAMFVVIPEGFELATEEHEEDSEEAGHEEEGFGNLLIGGAVLAGFLMMLILEGSGIGHAVHEEHHDHHDEHGHEHVHHGPTGWMLVIGLSTHAATDGLAIGSAAAVGEVVVTATVFLAVLVHKAPAAFSLGVFSMHERQSRNESVRDVVIFALSTPVMIMVAFYALADLDHQTIGLALLFSAGTFLYVATVDTLPDIHNPETGREALRNVLIGVVILTLILVSADYIGLLEHTH